MKIIQSKVGFSVRISNITRMGEMRAIQNFLLCKQNKEKGTMCQKLENNRAESIITTDNEEISKQTLVPPGNIKIIISVPNKPEAKN